MFDKEEKRLRVGHRRRRRAGTQRHAEVTTESTNARKPRVEKGTIQSRGERSFEGGDFDTTRGDL